MDYNDYVEFAFKIPFSNKVKLVGRGGGQVVSVLALYSDDPSSNLAGAYFFFKICVWKEQK